jgi:hypothetical protein
MIASKYPDPYKDTGEIYKKLTEEETGVTYESNDFQNSQEDPEDQILIQQEESSSSESGGSEIGNYILVILR